MAKQRKMRAMAEAVAGQLMAKGQTLATAESCTGGWIAKVITDLPGSSAWFAGGIVSYSNQAKAELLDVSIETLEREGAVSEATVREMAEGARQKFHVDVSIAVSGIAGPDGGTAIKPVGTVWIAWASANATSARHFVFNGNRKAVRKQTVMAALGGVIEL